jgi:acyl-CoA synthetase (NDP forming)
MTSAFETLFRPNSIAIIGASSDPTRIGGRPVRYLKEGGFAGRILPINPGRSEIQGLPAFASVDDIDTPIDCAVVALGPEDALEAARRCAARGVRQMVIFSAGFAEMGEVGIRRQAELVELCRRSGMRILGPNCLGAYSVYSGAFLTFSGVFDDVVGTRGRFGLVSQSGGYAGEVVKYAKLRGVEFGTWATTGNEADAEFGEVLHAMVESPDVDAIVAYVEGVRDRDSFIDALALARKMRKPIVLLKVGRTSEGAEAAQSHTASLAGADDIYDAVFQEYGVIRARNTPEMLDVAYALRRGIYPRDRRLAIVTNSGGLGIQAADFAGDAGMSLAETPAEARAAISRLLPNAATRNPVDTTGQVANEPHLFGQAVAAMLETGLYGSAYVNIGLIGGLPFLVRPLIDVFTEVARRFDALPLAVTVTAPPEVTAAYEAAGLLVYEDPSQAVRALGALASLYENWARGEPAVEPLGSVPLLEPSRSFSEVDAKAVLASVGIRGPEEIVAANPAAAAAAAARMEAPVAIKVVSPDIPHKSDVGGVALDVAPHEVALAVEKMTARIAEAAPKARIDGYLVTPMLHGGVECLVGIHRDPLFGPVVVFGIGGVTVEIYRDVVMRPAPVGLTEAHRMIRSIGGWPLLDGHRGRPAADVDALAQAIVDISRLGAGNADRIRTIEVNPLLILPRGRGAIALDAVVETGPIAAAGFR